MIRRSLLLTLALVCLLVVGSGTVSAAQAAPLAPSATLLTQPKPMAKGFGSTIWDHLGILQHMGVVADTAPRAGA